MIRRRTLLLSAGVAAVAAACSGAKKHLTTVPGTSGPGTSGPGTSGPSATGPETSGATGSGTTAAPSSSTPAATPAPAGPAAFLSHGASSSTGVALTFHTGGVNGAAVTANLLQQAATVRAKLTFFVVGTWAQTNPDLVARILDGGHELGNHTWSHINLPTLGPDAMYAEIERCAAVLQKQTGSISRWFRPSQTDVPSATILAQAGRAGYATSVGYDIDPLDYQDPGASAIASRVASKLHGGAIVSLHTLYPGTATAFPHIVASIRAGGLEPVATSAVLAG